MSEDECILATPTMCPPHTLHLDVSSVVIRSGVSNLLLIRCNIIEFANDLLFLKINLENSRLFL